MKSIHEIFAQIEIVKEILQLFEQAETREVIWDECEKKLNELNAEAEKVSKEMEIAYKKLEAERQ